MWADAADGAQCRAMAWLQVGRSGERETTSLAIQMMQVGARGRCDTVDSLKDANGSQRCENARRRIESMGTQNGECETMVLRAQTNNDTC
jgi:hypothetical protein